MRTTLGFYRIATAIAIIWAVVWQVTDRIANNVFRPEEYFSYFTIQTSIFTAMVLLVAGGSIFSKKHSNSELVRWRISAVSASIVVGIVYNLLLRDVPPAAADLGYEWPTVPNEILHVWAPIAVTLDWLITRTKTKVPTHSALAVTIFPLAWLAFSVIRGIATNWWPYWFINPNDPGGIGQMFTYIGAITVFFIVIGYGLVGVNRLSAKLAR